MSDLCERISKLKVHLDEAIEVERNLARRLAEQETALLGGAVEEIQCANAALDRVYQELREVSTSCTRAVAELYTDLGLLLGSPLRQVIERLPADEAPGLREQSSRLQQARDAARRQSARNATIARTSLDAIASVRGILSEAAQDPEAGAYVASSTSRLDARA